MLSQIINDLLISSVFTIDNIYFIIKRQISSLSSKEKLEDTNQSENLRMSNTLKTGSELRVYQKGLAVPVPLVTPVM